jgi:ribulose-bisphosphate carboxylase large chain
LIGTIIKPSVGLSPEDTAATVKVLAEAGIDFVKDDELMGSTANSPFEKRVDAIMDVLIAMLIKQARKSCMPLISAGDIDDMLRRYEKIVTSGGTCAMVSINSVGISGTKKSVTNVL